MLEVATNSSYRIAGREINSSDEFSKGMIYHKLKRLEIDEKYEEKRVKKKVKAFLSKYYLYAIVNVEKMKKMKMY